MSKSMRKESIQDVEKFFRKNSDGFYSPKSIAESLGWYVVDNNKTINKRPNTTRTCNALKYLVYSNKVVRVEAGLLGKVKYCSIDFVRKHNNG